MKQTLTLLFLMFFVGLFSQEKGQKHVSFEADYFYGTILEHNPAIGHLIVQHPEGVILKYSIKTFGFKEWERRYNYPDWGFTFSYQDMKTPELGKIYGLYSHISWYFLNRNIKLSVNQGIGYATNPYDRENNYRNNAFGSSVLSATILKLNYTKEAIWNGFGVQAGFSLFHYSNGNFKTPNTSANTFAFNVGINYSPQNEPLPDYIPLGEKEKYTEPIAFNFAFRTGLNESDVIGMGQYPFFIFSVFADKKLSRSSSVKAGTELFLSYFLRELIYYRSVAYPEYDITGNEDFKRVGMFLGYELRFNKVATFVNFGYYMYYPYDFEGRMYNRIGLKRYFGEKERIFALVNVRAHAAKAEAVEFGVGIRL